MAAQDIMPSSVEAARPDARVPEAAPSLTSSRGRTILATFTGAHFSHHVSTSLLHPLLPYIRDTFALTYAQSGLLVSAFSLSLGLSNAPMGVLADRFGPRVVIVVGLLLTGLASAALAFAGAWWQMLALLVMLGLVAGTYHAPANSLLAKTFPEKIRGAAIGFHITGGHFSFFATPALAAVLLASGETWRTPYLWFAIAPVLFGAVVWYLSPRDHQPPSSASRLAVFRELGSVVRLIGPLVTTSIIFQMAYAALLAFTTLYLVDARGVDGPLAAAMLGVPHLVGIVGAPLSGFLSDRLGRRTVMVAGMALMGPSLFLMTLTPNEFLVPAMMLVGLAASLRMTVTEVYVTDNAPAHRRATVLGGYYMLSQELGGLAAPALGALAVALGIRSAFGGACLALALLSVVVLLVHRRL